MAPAMFLSAPKADKLGDGSALPGFESATGFPPESKHGNMVLFYSLGLRDF